MSNFIQQRAPKLILFLSLLSLLSGCNASTASHLQSYKQVIMTLPTGEKLKTYIAESRSQQTKGLSGIKPKDFKDNEAMLFTGNTMMERQFWMPDTHFDLDIIFMNQDFYILDIHRSVPHFPRKPKFKGEVPLSKVVFSQHILEVKSNTKFSKKIHPGMQLKMMKQ